MDDLTSKIYENTIRYLHGISQCVPKNKILGSFYSSKFRIIQARGNMCLPVPKNKLQERCPKCCLQLSDLDPKCKVTPCKTTRFARKIARKYTNNKVLTSFQEKYLQKISAKQNSNELVVTCSFCANTMKINMSKPLQIKPIKIFTNNKKKKKKDRFCGLQQDVVNKVQNNQKIVSNPVNHVYKSKKANALEKRKREKLGQILNQGGKKSGKSNKLAGFLAACVE